MWKQITSFLTCKGQFCHAGQWNTAMNNCNWHSSEYTIFSVAQSIATKVSFQEMFYPNSIQEMISLCLGSALFKYFQYKITVLQSQCIGLGGSQNSLGNIFNCFSFNLISLWTTKLLAQCLIQPAAEQSNPSITSHSFNYNRDILKNNMVSFQNLDVRNWALRKEQPLYLRSVFIIWPLLSWDLLWLASLSGTACCGMADTVGWGCKYGMDIGREGFISSSSESLELFSLLDEEDEELLESDELSELLSWSMILASAFSSANSMICFSVYVQHNWNIRKRERRKKNQQTSGTHYSNFKKPQTKPTKALQNREEGTSEYPTYHVVFCSHSLSTFSLSSQVLEQGWLWTWMVNPTFHGVMHPI